VVNSLTLLRGISVTMRRSSSLKLTLTLTLTL
jgi:hypothetical protein